jgi:hexokinase
MARMQYRPATRRRGFQTQQLSTAGIARMREESNRVVQHMEKTRIAEKQERDKFLQSMKEDAEYTRRIRQENQETLLRNTETQFKQEMVQKLFLFQLAKLYVFLNFHNLPHHIHEF